MADDEPSEPIMERMYIVDDDFQHFGYKSHKSRFGVNFFGRQCLMLVIIAVLLIALITFMCLYYNKSENYACDFRGQSGLAVAASVEDRIRSNATNKTSSFTTNTKSMTLRLESETPVGPTPQITNAKSIRTTLRLAPETPVAPTPQITNAKSIRTTLRLAPETPIAPTPQITNARSIRTTLKLAPKTVAATTSTEDLTKTAVLTCPPQWRYGISACYIITRCRQFKTGRCNFDDAREMCERTKGGRLARVVSASLNEYLVEMAKRKGVSNLWVEGRRHSEVTHRWVYGNKEPLVYSNWSKGHPKASSDLNEDCIDIETGKATWFDWHCSHPYYAASSWFACEANPLPSNP